MKFRKKTATARTRKFEFCGRKSRMGENPLPHKDEKRWNCGTRPVNMRKLTTRMKNTPPQYIVKGRADVHSIWKSVSDAEIPKARAC